ncbi:hypothetical protein DH2020_015106 [Rehmannia glutinosa]|uniref:Uncharacterized protein n=1 Tax=Rehmannia glutinosa TaxID=99300 RepID=A0ABR0WZU5_REHGL
MGLNYSGIITAPPVAGNENMNFHGSSTSSLLGLDPWRLQQQFPFLGGGLDPTPPPPGVYNQFQGGGELGFPGGETFNHQHPQARPKFSASLLSQLASVKMEDQNPDLRLLQPTNRRSTRGIIILIKPIIFFLKRKLPLLYPYPRLQLLVCGSDAALVENCFIGLTTNFKRQPKILIYSDLTFQTRRYYYQSPRRGLTVCPPWPPRYRTKTKTSTRIGTEAGGSEKWTGITVTNRSEDEPNESLTPIPGSIRQECEIIVRDTRISLQIIVTIVFFGQRGQMPPAAQANQAVVVAVVVVVFACWGVIVGVRGGAVERFECRFECISTVGGSFLVLRAMESRTVRPCIGSARELGRLFCSVFCRRLDFSTQRLSICRPASLAAAR